MMFRSLSHSLLSFCVISALSAAIPGTAQVPVFSSGYVTPETISLAPSNFGSYGGEYFIPDAALGNLPDTKIYAVSSLGGTPTVFASNLSIISTGGMFLPSSGWGADSGNYIAVGATTDFVNGNGQVYAFNASGASHLLASAATSDFSSVALAPSNFGPHAGQLVMTDQNGRVVTLDNQGNLTTLVAVPNILPFGEAFTPSGFGKFGGQLLINDAFGNTIEAVNASGTVTPFANVTLKAGQSGLRQMIIAPAGFIPGVSGTILLVSVSGSTNGGGTLGDIIAYNAAGDEVASLRTDLGLTKFDPRGMYFVNDQTLLVNDASDPILTLTSSDFAPTVPEPGICTLFAVVGCLGAGLLTRHRRKR